MMILASGTNPHSTGPIRKPLHAASAGLRAAIWLAIVLWIVAAPARLSCAADAERPAATAAMPFVDYLATWKIDRASRAVLEEPTGWSPAKQEIAVKVLAARRHPTGAGLSREGRWTCDVRRDGAAAG